MRAFHPVILSMVALSLGACGSSQADDPTGDAAPESPDALLDSKTSATPDAIVPTADATFDAKADGTTPNVDSAADSAGPSPVDARATGTDGAADASPSTSRAIVIRYADVPPTSLGVLPSLVFGSGSIEPDMQFLIVGSKPLSCNQPVPPAQGGWWVVAIGIPPSMLAPGTLALQSPLRSNWSTCSADDCYSAGGGTFNGGTLDIVRIEPTVVVARLSNMMAVNALNTTIDANGTYDAVRCPPRMP